MKFKILSEENPRRPGETPINLGLGEEEPLYKGMEDEDGPEEELDVDDAEFGEAAFTDDEVDLESGLVDEEPPPSGMPDSTMGLDGLEPIDSMEPSEEPIGWTEDPTGDLDEFRFNHSDGYKLRTKRFSTIPTRWMVQLYDSDGNIIEKGKVKVPVTKDAGEIVKGISDKIISKMPSKPAPELPQPVIPEPEEEPGGGGGGGGLSGSDPGMPGMPGEEGEEGEELEGEDEELEGEEGEDEDEEDFDEEDFDIGTGDEIE